MRRLALLAVCALMVIAAQALMYCSTPLELADDGPDPTPPIIRVDTIFKYDTIFGEDSIIIDTVIDYDTIYITDTLFDGDIIYIYDTIIIDYFDTLFDTSFIFDTVFDTSLIYDTMFDTSYIYDTTFDTSYVFDTMFDTSYIYDTTFDTSYVFDTMFDTSYIYDTTILVDTITDTVGPDTVYITDTVIVIEVDTCCGLQGLCDILTPDDKKISWMLINCEGYYRFEWKATGNNGGDCPTLIVDIDDQKYLWNPMDDPLFIVEQQLGESAYVRVYPEKRNCFNTTFGICFTMKKSGSD